MSWQAWVAAPQEYDKDGSGNSLSTYCSISSTSVSVSSLCRIAGSRLNKPRSSVGGLARFTGVTLNVSGPYSDLTDSARKTLWHWGQPPSVLSSRPAFTNSSIGTTPLQSHRKETSDELRRFASSPSSSSNTLFKKVVAATQHYNVFSVKKQKKLLNVKYKM